jgi:TATA-binding protein-associated factor Taf7
VWGDANYEGGGGAPAWSAEDPADPSELTGVGMVDDDGMLGGAGGDEPVQMPEEAHVEVVQHEEAQAMDVEESNPQQQQQQQQQQGEAVEEVIAAAPAAVSLLSAERRAELDGRLADVEGRLATAEKGLADQEGQRNRAPNPALKKRFESSIAMFKKQVDELVAERDAIVAELAT